MKSIEQAKQKAFEACLIGTLALTVAVLVGRKLIKVEVQMTKGRIKNLLTHQ